MVCVCCDDLEDCCGDISLGEDEDTKLHVFITSSQSADCPCNQGPFGIAFAVTATKQGAKHYTGGFDRCGIDITIALDCIDGLWNIWAYKTDDPSVDGARSIQGDGSMDWSCPSPEVPESRLTVSSNLDVVLDGIVLCTMVVQFDIPQAPPP